MNVFIITFEQFKASLLNKSIDFYNFSPPQKKLLYWLQAFEWYSVWWIFIFIKESWNKMKITTEVLKEILGIKTCIA